MSIYNTGGLFKLNGFITATLSGGRDPAGQDGGAADYANFADSTAKLHITSGSTLIATHSVAIAGGSVFVIPNPNMPADQTATIQGNFFFRGGDIVFSPPIMIGNQLSYGKFTVNGDVRWSGGRYLPTIDCSQAGANGGWANMWKITGTRTTVAPAAGQTGPSVVPNIQELPAGGQIPVDKYWQIVQAGKITGPTPTFPQGWNSESIVDNNTNNVVGWRIKR